MKKIAYWTFALVVISLFLISILFLYTTPEAFVAYIGIENGYVAVFMLAFLAGISPITGASYIMLMLTLVAGGVNPIILAVTVTTGDALGGVVAYFLGRASSAVAPPGVTHRLEQWVVGFSKKHPQWFPIAIFVYGCIAPMSNDAITIPMGLVRYPFWKVIIPLQAGTFVYHLIIAFGGLYVLLILFLISREPPIINQKRQLKQSFYSHLLRLHTTYKMIAA